MTLIKCPECGKEISDKADNCPQCGYPVKPRAVNDNTAFSRRAVLNQSLRITKNSFSGFKLFSQDSEHVNLECTHCGKVFMYPREQFRDIDDEGATPLVFLSCPNCRGSFQSSPAKKHVEICKGFSLLSRDSLGAAHIECGACHRDIAISGAAFEKQFNKTTGNHYIFKTELKCSCGNTAKPGQTLSPKPGSKAAVKKGGGVSFWGVVGAILVALPIIMLIG